MVYVVESDFDGLTPSRWCGVEVWTTDDADVHIVKTAIETYEEIKKQVVVIGQDVDLLVLPTALTPDYIDILMLKKGKGKIKDRFYSSKDLRNSNLVIECKNPFSFFMRLVVVTQLQGSMEKENYKQCNCSTTVNTCICILIYAYLICIPKYVY
ncbi:hypothetical protein AVEN_264761-1 [Araneus ventricosus]|uniref:Uncharacterized protein n=1 Tax=Araneus ventricosus TaxID=182803 RepID=A0A4Y2EGD9_ARAVE|nr:hypothetical protein AVEN_264761-1 [Araneus ventricosus]